MKIVRDPIYQQLHDHLREQILAGEITGGERFLSEREIAEKFDVSRATANKVLSGLVSEGLLEFRKGVGTFVKPQASVRGLDGLRSFTNNVRTSGRTPSSIVLTFRKLRASKAPADIVRRLKVDEETELLEYRRVRCADDTPMILEHRFLVAEFCPGLKKSDLEGSLFALFVERFGLRIAGSDEVIQAVVITPDDAKLLQVEGTGAGFLVRSVGMLADSRPLWVEEAIHRPDGFEFRCVAVPARPVQDMRMQFVEPE